MSWFIAALKKYAVFGGRSRRREYWYFVLFSSIYSLAILIPSIAVSVRRLHDIDRTGWWVLVSFIPFIGTIVLLVFAALGGSPGSNRFGPNPKTAVA